MSAINNNSIVLPTDFSAAQAATSASDSSSTTGKPTSQGQGAPAAGAAASGTSAYASLQGTQGQPAQNINATLAQALGTVQGSIADQSSTGGDGDLSGILDSDGGAPQIVDAGLSSNQQVSGGQRESRGKKDSHSGSGGQSEQGQLYVGTAASGLQKGESTKSSSSVTSSHSVSSFTLKVDSSESKSSTQTTQSTTYTDSNGAPSIPPGPNVFAMVAECTELSQNLNSFTVSDMVAANKAQNANLQKEYANQITNIQNYISAKNQSNSKSNIAKAFSWAVDIAMIAAGVLTADPMLVAAGVMACILTANPQITNGLTGALVKLGIPKQAAGILSSTIFIAGACVCGGGVGAIGEGAMTAGSEAAIEAAANASEDAAANTVENTTTTTSKEATETATKEAVTNASNNTTENATENATENGSKEISQAASKAASKPIDWSGTWDALQTSEGRSAFLKGAAKGASDTITNAPGNVARSVTSIPSSVADSAASLYQLAGRISDACLSLGSKSLTEMLADIGFDSIGAAADTGSEASKGSSAAESASMTTSMQEAMSSLFSNLTSMEPIRMVQIAADLTMAALVGTGSVIQYNASMLAVKAQKDEASVLLSKAQTTELNSLIMMGNTQIQEILNDMNNSINSAGQTISGYSLMNLASLSQSSA